MLIAVIVPAFNVAPFLGDTIRSVLGQTHADWSLVVVDDGSSDPTAEVASGFSDSRIHVLRQVNAGVSSARNRGIAYARRFAAGAFLFLDGDDWLAPDALQLLADSLAAAPAAVAACGRYARVSGSGAVHAAPAPPEGTLLKPLLTRNLFANCGHLLIRSEAVVAAGIFRPELSYGEDWEYCARLALLGDFTGVAPPEPLLFVRERPNSAYLSRATDPDAYRPAMDLIHGNPDIVARLGAVRVADLRRRADAETAWAVGRELIRHGQRRDGLGWLAHSFRIVPTARRLALIGFSCLRLGPFRPYRVAI